MRDRCVAIYHWRLLIDNNQLWGSNMAIFPQYHGEGTPILEWMGNLGINSILLRGTKIFKVEAHETTIDLALALDRLA